MRLIYVCLAIGIALLSPPCLGQDDADSSSEQTPPSSEASPSTTAQPPLEMIQPADITSQAAEFTLWLQQVETDLQAKATVAQLALDFSAQAQPLAELRLELDRSSAAGASTRQLEEQRREWRQADAQIDTWMRRADERWKSLQQTRDEISQVRARWELTSQTIPEDDLPEELQRRIASIITSLDALQADVRQRNEQVAELTERLAEARSSTTEALSRLNELIEHANRRLVTREAPPLWETQEAQWLALDNTTRATATRWCRDIQSFVADHSLRVLLHVLLYLALTWAIVAARQSCLELPEEDQPSDRARFLVTRPFAVGLVFAVLAGYFIYGPLPLAPHELLYLIILFPVLYLASGLTEASERAGMFGLLILSGLFQFVQFCSDGTLLTRTLLLVTEIAAMVIAGYAILRCRAESEPPKTLWGRVAAVFYLLVLATFLIAFMANILGWVNLSQFLTESTLLTCKGAILAVLVYRAGAGLWQTMLRQGFARRSLSIRRHTMQYERIGLGLLALLLLYIWSQQTLRRFRLSEPLANELNAIWSTPLSWADMDITVGHVARALLILAATFVAQRVLSFLLNEELFPRLHMRTSTTAIFARLLKYVIVAVGLAMAVSALGFTATQLTVLFGALGVGIGFGLQNIVNNFVSGLILMFERPVKVGDVVEVGGNWGKIKEIGVRATSVVTFDGAEIVVPNGDLISNEVKNWTLSDSAARVEVLVGAAYGSDAREVLEILTRTAKESEFVFAEPEPFAMMYGFGESALDFRLLCWTSIENRGIVTNQVHVAVYEALTNAGIDIPLPQRDLHLKSAAANLPEFDEFNTAD